MLLTTTYWYSFDTKPAMPRSEWLTSTLSSSCTWRGLSSNKGVCPCQYSCIKAVVGWGVKWTWRGNSVVEQAGSWWWWWNEVVSIEEDAASNWKWRSASKEEVEERCCCWKVTSLDGGDCKEVDGDEEKVFMGRNRCEKVLFSAVVVVVVEGEEKCGDVSAA